MSSSSRPGLIVDSPSDDKPDDTGAAAGAGAPVGMSPPMPPGASRVRMQELELGGDGGKEPMSPPRPRASSRTKEELLPLTLDGSVLPASAAADEIGKYDEGGADGHSAKTIFQNTDGTAYTYDDVIMMPGASRRRALWVGFCQPRSRSVDAPSSTARARACVCSWHGALR